MKTIETASAAINGFLENKDFAAEQRDTVLLPALRAGDNVVIDFGGVGDASQSFVHALIATPLREVGESFLERVEFRNAGPAVQEAVRMVVGYTLASSDSKQSA